MSTVALPAADATGQGLRRELGLIALMFTSVGSVIGSGWLLGALNATTIAGPAAVISWVIGYALVVYAFALTRRLPSDEAIERLEARLDESPEEG